MLFRSLSTPSRPPSGRGSGPITLTVHCLPSPIRTRIRVLLLSPTGLPQESIYAEGLNSTRSELPPIHTLVLGHLPTPINTQRGPASSASCSESSGASPTLQDTQRSLDTEPESPTCYLWSGLTSDHWTEPLSAHARAHTHTLWLQTLAAHQTT